MSRINVGSDVVRLSFIMVLTCRTRRYVARLGGSCVAALLRCQCHCDWPCILRLIVLLCDSHSESAFPVDSELEHWHPRLCTSTRTRRFKFDAGALTPTKPAQAPARGRLELRLPLRLAFFGKHLDRLRNTPNGIQVRPSPSTDAEPAPGRASHQWWLARL